MDFYVLTAEKFLLGILVMILQINILGKYEFSVNTPLNQIQNYVLGGIIGGVIYNSSISVLTFLIVLLIWSLVVIVVKLLINNQFIKSLVVGNPVILIKNGKVNVANCAQVGISADQLMLHLRTEGVSSTKDVKSAIMEPNGKLTILDKNSETPKFPLISNGRINYDVLELIDHEEEWLINMLNKQGIESPREIFLAEYRNKELYLVPYSEK
ncbi:DUF421 domain-containing protein [Streptococcus gallolyticus]|uniref:Uncharacterized membrane protein YcaP, DUF421 family n=1 Tax=Streptococcus gallolyticus TaxID=315405 RepID=A0A1H9N0N8_9STRE|nr:DUF421 domain-containing protein [Streptococcus gallolyticus]MCY7171368.1 DUF421 domain-containing protein [Streptococcus gallolyticus subsp. gallolyticus]MCY7186497.1 DUF421 domain-containing protein [Streptococcus gallolyticus subsp. gallolyticus]SER29337.1 Uncharacterized membrane protein YcaP, DUF421 family [Streptococcus gallolyticus]